MPPQMLHMILPRKDYEIVEDPGRGGPARHRLQGRHRQDAFVPAYRTMDAFKVMDGTAQREAGMTETLYLMPWSTMFPLGILGHHRYRRGRSCRASGLSARTGRRGGHRHQGRSLRDVRDRRGRSRHQRRPPEILANADRIYDIVDPARRCRSPTAPPDAAPRSVRCGAR